MKIALFILFLVQLGLVTAQGKTENVFTARKYWTEKPSLQKIQADIDKGNDPSAFNAHKFDAVTWAILEKNSHEVIWFLLQQEGNDVNRRSHDGRTPIFWAAYKNDLALMKSLVEKKAKTDLLDEHGYSVVNFAASTGQMNLEIYEFCEQQGTDLTTEKAKDGATPLLLLMSAIQTEKELAFFTSRGLSIYEVDHAGNNAFVYAAKTGNEFMMDYLLSKDVDPNVNSGEALRMAIKGTRSKKNELKTFMYLVEHGVSANGQNEDKETVFHVLAKYNSDTLIYNYFLALDVPLNVYDKANNHPIFNAIESNDLLIIDYILSRSAEIKNNVAGENVIHAGVKRGDAGILQLILENSVVEKVNMLSKEGLTPLHVAAMTSKNDAMLRLLLAHGAMKEIKTEFEETAYDLAKENELLQNVDLNFLK